jgi:hypothetical protein
MIDPECLGFPEEETLACEDGLMENHHYLDLRKYNRDDYLRMKRFEDELLTYTGDLGSDEASEDLMDNEVFALGIDPGVASTVFALRAVGAVPLTSCCGGPGHYEDHPLVVFWCSQEQLDLIQQAASKVGGIEVEGAATPGVIVFTRELDTTPMRKFAQHLFELTGS